MFENKIFIKKRHQGEDFYEFCLHRDFIGYPTLNNWRWWMDPEVWSEYSCLPQISRLDRAIDQEFLKVMYKLDASSCEWWESKSLQELKQKIHFPDFVIEWIREKFFIPLCNLELNIIDQNSIKKNTELQSILINDIEEASEDEEGIPVPEVDLSLDFSKPPNGFDIGSRIVKN